MGLFLKRVKDRRTGVNVEVWEHVFFSNDQRWQEHQEQVADVYKFVFAGAPYYENFRGQQEAVITPMFTSFAAEGVAVLLTTSKEFLAGDVIGFAGCLPALRSDVGELIATRADLPHPARSYMYMAELGVLEEYRRQGLGLGMILSRARTISQNPGFCQTHLLVRTAAEGSNSLQLYQRLGGRLIPGLVEEKQEFGTASRRRVFMELPLDFLKT